MYLLMHASSQCTEYVYAACSAAQAAWRAMEGLVSEGLVRSLGIQDASVEALGEVLGYAAIPPAVHSLEVHPGNRNDALLAFCRSQVGRNAARVRANAL